MCIMNSDNGIIKGCINLSDVSTGYSGLSESSMGGIAAKNVSVIENCINKGNFVEVIISVAFADLANKNMIVYPIVQIMAQFQVLTMHMESVRQKK